MIYDREEAAKNIKIFRYNMGYTQQELANFLKIDKIRIFRAEKYGEISEQDLYNLAEIFYIKDINEFYKPQEKKKLTDMQKKLKEIEYIFNTDRDIKYRFVITETKIGEQSMIFHLQKGKYEWDDEWTFERDFTLNWNTTEKCYLETIVLNEKDLAGVSLLTMYYLLIETNKKFPLLRCNLTDNMVYIAMPCFVQRFKGYFNDSIDGIELKNDMDNFVKQANEIAEYLKDKVEDLLLSDEELTLKKERMKKYQDDCAIVDYEIKEGERYENNPNNYMNMEEKYGYDDDAIETSPEYWENLNEIDEFDSYKATNNSEEKNNRMKQIDNEISKLKEKIAKLDDDIDIEVQNDKLPITYWELKHKLRKK